MRNKIHSQKLLYSSGKGRTSLNAHCGPVDFLMSASSSLASDFRRQDSILSSSEEGADGEGGGKDEGRGIHLAGDEIGLRLERSSRPNNSEAHPMREGKPKCLLLQYHLNSTSQLPGKLLTALPEQGSVKTSPDSLDHIPEDGSIYEVSEDPDVWVRGRASDQEREARRSKFTSTAIFAGGRGYRRIDKPVSADSTENTLLVWQLPLCLSQ